MNQSGSLFQKERKQIVILLLLALLCLGGMLYLSPFYKQNRMEVKKQEQRKTLVLEELKPPSGLPKIPSIPFLEDNSILEKTQDDPYLETHGFFYLLHKVYFSTPKELESFDPKFHWLSLVNIEGRSSLRGKRMKIRGTLVDIKRKAFQGEIATSRGMESLPYWQGAIYDGDHLFLFAITDFPEKCQQGDTVELIGAFLKIWIYESRKGVNSHAPFFIGKQLRFIVEKEPQGTESMNYVLAIFLSIILALLAFNIYNERKFQKSVKNKKNIFSFGQDQKA